jgi:hypothetical protein
MHIHIYFYISQDKSQINVLLLENVNARAVQMLRDEGYQVLYLLVCGPLEVVRPSVVVRPSEVVRPCKRSARIS